MHSPSPDELALFVGSMADRSYIVVLDRRRTIHIDTRFDIVRTAISVIKSCMLNSWSLVGHFS